jgi:hypothetical protein
MVTSYGTPLAGAEAAEFAGLDLSGMDSLMRTAVEGADQATQGIHPHKAITDRVVMYHPDPRNPSSIYVVPTNAQDRRVKVLSLLSKRVMYKGQLVQWNNVNPQVEASELPFRCFVDGCQRAGGLPSRAELINHVNGRHQNEAPLYQKLIERLMEQVYRDIDPEAYAALGIEAPEESESASPVKKRTPA